MKVFFITTISGLKVVFLVTGEFEMLHSLYDFKATYAKTLSFKANEFFILQQTNTKHKNWWEVINERGDIGYIPCNYVESVTVNASFYVRFLENALENLKRRDSEDMVVGTKTDVLNRLRELRKQVSFCLCLSIRSVKVC